MIIAIVLKRSKFDTNKITLACAKVKHNLGEKAFVRQSC